MGGQAARAQLGHEHGRDAADVGAHEFGQQTDAAGAQLLEQRIDERSVARVGLSHGRRLRLAAHRR